MLIFQLIKGCDLWRFLNIFRRNLDMSELLPFGGFPWKNPGLSEVQNGAGQNNITEPLKPSPAHEVVLSPPWEIPWLCQSCAVSLWDLEASKKCTELKSHPQVVVHIPGSAAGIGCRGSCAEGEGTARNHPWTSLEQLLDLAPGFLLSAQVSYLSASPCEWSSCRAWAICHSAFHLFHCVHFWMQSASWNGIKWSLESILFAVSSAPSCSLLWCETMKFSPWKQHVEYYR